MLLTGSEAIAGHAYYADHWLWALVDKLATFLEREAVHVCISFAVLVVATIFWRAGFPGAEALAGAAGGWLGRSMGSK